MKLKPIVLAALACVCAAGCRTTKDVLDDYEKNLSLGNYGGSTPELLELADKRDDSQLLWRLMAAATLHFTNTREADAIRQFDLAEAVLQKNDQTSVFAQGGEGALAMMTNDRAFSYDGGGLDRIFTCVYRGIDFLCTGNRDNARVEFNRAAQYQRNWLYDRRKDIDAAAQKLESDAASYQKQQNAQAVDTSGPVNAAMADSAFGAQIREQTGFDPATSGRLDALSQAAYVNAYAAHLAGVFRWVNGDNGLDDLKLAAAVKPGDACVARDFAECSRGGKPSNQVWIWWRTACAPRARSGGSICRSYSFPTPVATSCTPAWRCRVCVNARTARPCGTPSRAARPCRSRRLRAWTISPARTKWSTASTPLFSHAIIAFLITGVT